MLDFAVPIGTRASKTLGPISRHFVAQILPITCNAARDSRPELAVGILRVLCNGVCTAQRFHIDGEEKRCRVGCHDEPDSLSHYNECPPSSLQFRHRCLEECRSQLSDTTSEKGNDFQGWTIYTDGGTLVSACETTAGWSAVARSPLGKVFAMFGPVVTAEAHSRVCRGQNPLQEHL